jgi:hypothetical protein
MADMMLRQTREPRPGLSVVFALAGVAVSAIAALLVWLAWTMDSMEGYEGYPMFTGMLLVGGPGILIGVGLLALASRLNSSEIGPPPLWHRIVGGLSLAVGLLVLGLVLLNAGAVFATGLAAHRPFGGLLAAFPSVAVTVSISAVAIWLGITLVRPQR